MQKTKFKPIPPETWAANLLQAGFMVWDTETTGIGADAKICSIGIVDHLGAVVLDTLVNPGVHIPQEATRVHGITDQDVAQAPTFKQLYVHVYRALHNQTWVIYNAQYDTARLAYECQRIGVRPPLPYPAPQCAMLNYADYRGERDHRGRGNKWHKLTEAVRQQGIEVVDAHNATGDALMTLALVQKMAGE